MYCFFFISLYILCWTLVTSFFSSDVVLRLNKSMSVSIRGTVYFGSVSFRVVTCDYRRAFQKKVLVCNDRNISYRIRYLLLRKFVKCYIILVWIRVHSRPMRAKRVNLRRKIFWNISCKKSPFRRFRGTISKRIDCTIKELCVHFMYFVWTMHKTAGISHQFLQSPWIVAYWFFLFVFYMNSTVLERIYAVIL